MKTITIGRQDCDIIISDSNVSRQHATISLVDGQYVYHDLSKNGTTIAGKTYYNEKVVVAPGTPIFLANKVQLPWAQVLMLLPNAPLKVQNPRPEVYEPVQQVEEPSIGILAGIFAFLFPIVGIILYFVWNDSTPARAKQALNIALISFAISFVFGFLVGLAA